MIENLFGSKGKIKILRFFFERSVSLTYFFLRESTLRCSNGDEKDDRFVFGSLVTGSYTSRSNADLFFIAENEEKVRDACNRGWVRSKNSSSRDREEWNKKFKNITLSSSKKDSFVFFDKENLKGRGGYEKDFFRVQKRRMPNSQLTYS